MTQDLLVTIGEEYILTEQVDGVTLRVGLYNDKTDSVGENDNYDAITTEPPNDAYGTVDESFTAAKGAENWGISNDGKISYDFSDTTDDTIEVDTAFILANFQSDEAGSTSWHLIANPSLTQSRKIGSIDTLEISSGDLKLNLE